MSYVADRHLPNTDTVADSQNGALLGGWFLNNLRNHKRRVCRHAYGGKKIDIFYEGNRKALLDVAPMFIILTASNTISSGRTKPEKIGDSVGSCAKAFPFYAATVAMRSAKTVIEERTVELKDTEQKMTQGLSEPQMKLAMQHCAYYRQQIDIFTRQMDDSKLCLSSLIKANRQNQSVNLLTLYR